MTQNVYQAPAVKLSTSRGLLKYIVLTAITFGIYGLVVMCGLSSDINTIASRYDGKKTNNFLLMALIFTPLTLGIAPLCWYHKISNRIGNELKRRGIGYSFSAGSFWGWNILGSMLFGIGPLVYCYKLFIPERIFHRCI